MNEPYQLTPVEHELMEILWQLKKGSVREVLAALPHARRLAYTSVSTILRILQQKNILTAEKAGRHHVYVPLLSKEAFTSHSVKKMVKQVFSGSPINLMSYLVNQDEFSIKEIDFVQQLLDTKKKGWIK